MPKPFEKWTVLPHGKLAAIDDDILTVAGDIHMPLGDFPRRMTVVRLSDGRLVVWSAIALDENEMRAIDRFGRVTYLVVPNDAHRLDAKIWKERYPDVAVLAPPAAAKKVSEVVAVDLTTSFDDPHARLETVAGTDEHEVALVVSGSSGTTLVVNDLIWNVDDRPGFGGFLFKTLGMTGHEPKIPALTRMREVKDKSALARHLEVWSTLEDLRRIIVSHGDIIDANPRAVLRHLADSLEHKKTRAA